MTAKYSQPNDIQQNVLRSRKRNGEYVTFGTVSMVGRGFAPKEKVTETLKEAHERSKETLHKSRHSCLVAVGGVKSGHPVTT